MAVELLSELVYSVKENKYKFSSYMTHTVMLSVVFFTIVAYT